MLTVPDPDWQRLAELVVNRRHELGLTQEQAVERGRTVKLASWKKVESGRYPNLSKRTLAGVARGLRWTPDSIDRILDGKEPKEALKLRRTGPRPDVQEISEEITASLRRVQAHVEEITQQLAADQEAGREDPELRRRLRQTMDEVRQLQDLMGSVAERLERRIREELQFAAVEDLEEFQHELAAKTRPGEVNPVEVWGYEVLRDIVREVLEEQQQESH